MPQDDDPQPVALPEPPEITFRNLGLATRTAKALEDMALLGLPYTHAARKHSMRSDNLLRAFNSPRTRAVYNQIVKAIRENAGTQAYVRIVDLSATSKSDQVKLEANKWIAGVDNIAPIKRVEGKYMHSHSFGGFTFGQYDAKDVTPTDNPSDGDDD